MLKYYDEEAARWGYLSGIEADEAQVVRAVRRWANRFICPRGRSGVRFRIQFRVAKSEWSWATKENLILTYPVNWLLVAHEFAHLVQWRRRYKRRIWHGAYHRALVDALCRDVIRQGYDVDSLKRKT